MKKAIRWRSYEINFDALLRKATEVSDADKEKIKLMSPIDASLHDDIDVIKMEAGVSTPLGIFNILDPMNPLRHYELRIADTTFSLTEEMAEQLDQAPGVEILRIISRYSFVIGIGKMFSFTDVRRDIEKLLCEEEHDILSIIVNVKLKDEVKQLISSFAGCSDWIIYVFPNGRIVSTTDREANFLEAKQIIVQSQHLSQGLLLTPQHV